MVNLGWTSDSSTSMSGDGSFTRFYDSLGKNPSYASLLAHSLFSRQNIPACAGTCIASANIGGCAATDDACLCKSETFVSGTAACIENTCTGSDLSAAITAAESLCAAVGVTLSDVPTGSPTTAGASSPATTSVASSPGIPASSSSPPASSSSPPASSSGASSTLTTSASSNSVNGGSTVIIGPIVGGVVGFLALVAFVVVGLTWFRISRRKRGVWVRRSPSLTSVEHSPVLPSSPIEPFPNPSTASQNPGHLPSSNQPTLTGGPLAPPSMKQLEATGLNPTTTERPSLMQMSSSSASTPIGGLYSRGILGNTSRLVLHEDSGIRLPRQAGENEVVVEMPPMYTSI